MTSQAVNRPKANGSAALLMQSVDASYGPYRALFDVNLQVPAGVIVALLGSNGAGKSTVARVASGLLPCTGGTVRVGSTDVTNADAYRIARLGLAHVPEGRGIFASLTVEENLVVTFRQRAGRRRVAASLGRAYQAFPLLKERRKQLAGTLSGGQQRLLSLCPSLVLPPKLLIADELCLGLAPTVVDLVYQRLREINRAGTALLVVEQQINRILDIAQWAVIVERGSVAYDGPVSGAAAAMEELLKARGEHDLLTTNPRWQRHRHR